MAIQTLTLNVNAKPSAEDRDFLYLSQNENGRDIRLRVLGDDLPSERQIQEHHRQICR